MIPVPAGYARAIAPGNLTVARYIDLRHDSDLTQQPDYFAMPVTGGSVTIDSELTKDGGGFHRVSGQITALDEDGRFNVAGTRLTPTADNQGWTSPYGTTARVMYAVEVPGYTGFYGDSFLWTPYGTVRIGENEDTGDGQLVLSLFDFARYISRNHFQDPYVIAAGQNTVTSIITGVQSRMAPNMNAAVISSGSNDLTTLSVIDPEQDPWVEFEAMAASIGYVLYFDLYGQITLVPRPDPTTDGPVRSFIHGVDAIVALARNLSDDPGYNGVDLRSESSLLSSPIHSVVWDSNPNSPTYYLGPYGQCAYQVTSPYVATQAQGDVAAAALLPAVLGLTEKITVACLPDPALQVNDVIYVQRTRSGIRTIDGNYIIDQIQLPLTLTEPMTLQAHRQRASL